MKRTLQQTYELALSLRGWTRDDRKSNGAHSIWNFEGKTYRYIIGNGGSLRVTSAQIAHSRPVGQVFKEKLQHEVAEHVAKPSTSDHIPL